MEPLVAARKGRALQGFQPAITPNELKTETAIGKLQSICRSEGLEATTVEDAIEMHAWDLGYQNEPIPDWLTYLGKQFKILVKKHHSDGRKAAAES